MANNQNFKVKNGLNVADEATIVGNLTARGLLYPTADGTDKQVLTTDGSGAITLQTPSTTNVTEGSNLYYTDTRVRDAIDVTDAGGDGSLSYDPATGIITYTGPSAAEVRAHLSHVDAGGDGSFSYDNATGVMTYTGPSATETRAHFNVDDQGGDGSLTYNNTTGEFTYVGPSATEVRAHFSVSDQGGDGSLSYDNTTGEITYTGPSATEVRAHFTGGTGVTIASGEVAIGQPVATTDEVTFAEVHTTRLVDAGGTITIDPTDDGANTGDVIIAGNLTISGTTTTVSTNDVNIGDSVVVLNANETGAPSQNAGIEIERGTSANKSILWDETNDKWTVGSEYFVASTFEGALTGNVTGDVLGNVTGDVTGNADTASALETARDITLAGDVTGTASFDGSASITITTAIDGSAHDHTSTDITDFEEAVEDVMGTAIVGGNAITATYDDNAGTITLDHSDTSSVATTALSAGNVFNGITFDTYGHTTAVSSVDLDGRYYTETELDAGQLDNRYYTETEADANFVNVTGGTITGDLNVNDTLTIGTNNVGSETDLAFKAQAAVVGEENMSFGLTNNTDGYYRWMFGNTSNTGGTAGATEKMKLDKDGNLTLSGTVDGRDVATDGTKLDTVETNADVTDTVNVTAAGALMDSEVTNLADVKAFDPADYQAAGNYEPADATILKDADIGVTVQAYDANLVSDATYVKTDENFTTADHSKLDAIETLADVTDTVNVTAAGALMDSEVTNLAQVKAFDTTDYATAAQGTLADDAQPALSEGLFVDGDKTKLDTIETNADVTDTVNVTAAGALMDSEVTNLAQVKAFDSSDYATAAQGTLADSALQSSDIGTSVQAHSAVLDATTASYTTAEETKLAGIESLADVTDTANVVAALTAGTNIAISAGGEISSTNTNTTYSVSVPAATTSIRLSGNDSSTDDIAIVGGTNVTVTRTDDSTLTFDSVDTNTTYTAGNGIDLSGTEFTVSAGTGLAQTATGLAHADTSSLSGAYGQTSTEDGSYIKSITVDANGHLTAVTTDDFDDRYDMYTGWNIAANGTSGSSSITANNTVTFTGSGGTAVTRSGDNITITTTEITNNNQLTNGAGYVTTDTTYTAGNGLQLSGTEFSVTAVALTTVQTAASQVAQLALTAQEGDVVVRSDENKTYMHNGGTAGTMADYTVLATPTDTVLSVDGQTGAVTLNHDSLAGFVANEHIDWTADSAGTIHASNYTNTTYTITDGQLSQNNFTNTLKSKLDGIEATADITDTANVTAAGALMDSEVTNLDQVKAFDETDYVAVTGDSMTGDLSLGDDNKAIFGAGSDLQIYHDGAASYISESGTGGLNITGNGGNISLYDTSNSEYMVRANIGTDVELYYAGDEKLSTTSTGVEVTGNIVVSGNVDGVDVAQLKTDFDNSITEVVDDTTPQLGGNLDVNGNDITSTADITLDAAGDIYLNADGADIILADGAVEFGRFKRDNGDLVIKSETQDKDILFKGNDGGGTITALTLDMSESGLATFNSNVQIAGNNIVLNSAVTGTPSTNAGIEVERGTSTNVTLVWNETDDAWDLNGEELQNVVLDGGSY